MPHNDSLKIIGIPALKDNYIWTIINNHQQALIIDPGEAKPIMDFLKDTHTTLSGILVTHHHWDHTNGIKEIVKQFPVPVFGLIQENIPDVTHSLNDGNLVSLPLFPEFKCIAIPGHTLGHTAYHTKDILFTGDTLFGAGCGRLFEGTAEQLYHSLQKITALPDHTRVYCGHEYTLSNLKFAKTIEPENNEIDIRMANITKLRNQNQPSLPSTIHDEKLTNPFLRCTSLEIINNVEKFANQRLHTPIEVFTWLRKWKDTF